MKPILISMLLNLFPSEILSDNVIDVDDILSVDFMPGALLVLENPKDSPNTFNETLKRLNKGSFLEDGSFKHAMETMGFHRLKMNEYLCRSYIAEQIINDMTLSRMKRRMGQHSPDLFPTKKNHRWAKNELLQDEGSTNYKDWLTKSTTLEDIYRHYDKSDVENRIDEPAAEDADKDDEVNEDYDGHITGYNYQQQNHQHNGSPSKLGHSGGGGIFYGGGGGGGGGGYPYPHSGVPQVGGSGHGSPFPGGGGHSSYGGGSGGGGGFGHSGTSGHGGGGHSGYGHAVHEEHVVHEAPPTKYHIIHHDEHHSSGKEHDLSQLFEIALTALAFLAFKCFIIHVIMCISMSTNTSTTTAASMMMPMSMSPTATGPTGMTGGGTGGGMTGGGMTGTGGDMPDMPGMTGTGGGDGGGATGTGDGMAGTGGGGDGDGGDGGGTGDGGGAGDGGGGTGDGGGTDGTGDGGGGTGDGGGDGGGTDGTGDGGGVTGDGGGNGGGDGGGTDGTGDGGGGTGDGGGDGGGDGDGGGTGDGMTAIGGGDGGGDGDGGTTSDTDGSPGTGTGGGGTGTGGGATGMDAGTGGTGTGTGGTSDSGTGNSAGDGGDTFKFRLRRDVPSSPANADNRILNELARRVLKSIEAALIANEDNGSCLRKTLCENNKYSRNLKDNGKILIPVWSLGMSWMSGRLTKNVNAATSMLDSLKASILGLGRANCDIIYQDCNLGEQRRRRRRRKRSTT